MSESVLVSERTKKLVGLAVNKNRGKCEKLGTMCLESTKRASEKQTVKHNPEANNDILFLENLVVTQGDSSENIQVTTEFLEEFTLEQLDSIPFIIDKTSNEFPFNPENQIEGVDEFLPCSNDEMLINESENSVSLVVNLNNYVEGDLFSADEILELHNNNNAPCKQVEANNLTQINENDQIETVKKTTKTEELRNQSKKRVKGKEYIGCKRVGTKVVGRTEKKERKLKARCNHSILVMKSKRSFLCATVSEEKRQEIFNYFWRELPSWKEKITYVKALVSSRKLLKRRSESKLKVAKLEGHDIMFENDSRDKVRVCRKFFLNTLDLGEDSFKRWTSRLETISDSDDEADKISTNNIEEDEANDDEEVNHLQKTRMRELIKEKKKLRLKKKGDRKNKKTINMRQILTGQKREILEEWLSLIPKVPSHYCRASSSKIYVESTFKSWNHMFKIYKKWCIESDKKYFGRKQFTFILQKVKNIGIHKPRKDQCDTCSEYKVGNLPEEEYSLHLAKKERSREAKRKIIGEANDKKLVITMDLQSVLLAPKTKASAMYYKQKLQVHDFSMYEINSKDVYLYVWHEVDGGVSCNEFTTCIIDYLSSKLQGGYEKFVLISDGCNYQNRNKVLASALRDFSKKWSVEISQLILEKGHTQMEVDSVHATLEGFFYPPINAPSDYVCRMRMAREKQPYKIKVVDYDFFKNYSALETNLKSLRPGNRVGESCVTDIRQLLYLPSGDIKYNLDYDNENFRTLEQKTKRLGEKERNEPEKLYNTKIPITENKYKNLQELKSVLDKDFHIFYDSLPYKSESKKRSPEDKASPSPLKKKKKSKQ